MSFYWFKMFLEWKNMKIKEPKQKVIIKNTSTDDFMKIHLPWIL